MSRPATVRQMCLIAKLQRQLGLSDAQLRRIKRPHTDPLLKHPFNSVSAHRVIRELIERKDRTSIEALGDAVGGGDG